MNIRYLLILLTILLYPCITSAGVVINGIKISESGKIIYLDKTEQGTATLKGDRGDKGDLGDKGNQGDKGDKGEPGVVDKAAICQVYADDNLPAPPFCGKKVIFLTSQKYSAALGGLEGADLKCQTAATTASLSGTFKAWLSDTYTSAKDRLTHSPAAYIRTDGTIVAVHWNDLTDGWLKDPIVCDEFKECTYYLTHPDAGSGNPIKVFTNTSKIGILASTGTNAVENCNDWTQTPAYEIAVGNAASIDSTWTQLPPNSGSCMTLMRLYCIEQ